MIDQRSLVGNRDLSESRPVFEALFAKDSDPLKPLYYLLCPPFIDAFILQEQKQSKNLLVLFDLRSDIL